jgi:starch phosphorylase
LLVRAQALIGVELPTDPLYDIQIKRIHEYKRQYLNILSLIWRYHQIKTASPEEKAKMVPRVSMFGGKAASAYYMAKKIVRLINCVGSVVNNDPDVGDLLKVCHSALTTPQLHCFLLIMLSWYDSVSI